MVPSVDSNKLPGAASGALWRGSPRVIGPANARFAVLASVIFCGLELTSPACYQNIVAMYKGSANDRPRSIAVFGCFAVVLSIALLLLGRLLCVGGTRPRRSLRVGAESLTARSIRSRWSPRPRLRVLCDQGSRQGDLGTGTGDRTEP